MFFTTCTRSTTAVAALTLSASLCICSDIDASILGPGGEFNAFIFQDVDYQNTDFEGRVAVGGNVLFNNIGVGSQLPNSAGLLDHMIVGGNVDWTNGQVFGGNLRYGGTASLTGLGLPDGTAYQASPPFDFAAEQSSLEQSSSFWAGLAATGTVDNTFGAMTLTGTDASLNIFHVDGSSLGSATGLTIDAPAGSTVLINVDGTNAQMQNFGFFLNGVANTDILFNFHEADELNMSGIGVQGSILAPFADVNFANGQMDGTLIANSLSGSGELHHVLFDGNLPPVPAPGAIVLLGLFGITARRRRRL